MTKHKPATPLPWVTHAYHPDDERRDVDYKDHAANAYPKLVEEVQALRKLLFTYQDGLARNILDMPRFQQSAALLRELGEAA